jgi:hypothetical protein
MKGVAAFIKDQEDGSIRFVFNDVEAFSGSDNPDWKHERIELLVRLVREVVSPVKRVLDFGCGTESLMKPFLDRFPDAEIYGGRKGCEPCC